MRGVRQLPVPSPEMAPPTVAAMVRQGARPAVTPDAAAVFLENRHVQPVEDLEQLAGGFWSSAFAYRSAGRDLVVRFGTDRAGYDADRAAMIYAGPDLPVPEVIEIGYAFGGAYAISVRARGRFLEDVAISDAERAGPMLQSLLGALHARRAERPGFSWRGWLLEGIADEPGPRPTTGWRQRVDGQSGLRAVVDEADRRIRTLVDACPERRDLVHGDLLHGNVLVAEDASEVRGVFSWKCSVPGDFLFDTAWCTFWDAWHPGIAAVDAWDLITSAPWSQSDLGDAAERHFCYELHIGVTHIGWTIWTENDDELRRVTARLDETIQRGPRR